MDYRSKCKCKAINLLEENQGEILKFLGLGREILDIQYLSIDSNSSLIEGCSLDMGRGGVAMC